MYTYNKKLIKDSPPNEKEKHLTLMIAAFKRDRIHWILWIWYSAHLSADGVWTWKQTRRQIVLLYGMDAITFLCAFAFNFFTAVCLPGETHERAIEWLTNIVIIYGASGTAVHDAWSNTRRGICARRVACAGGSRSQPENPSGAIRLLLIVDAPTFSLLCFHKFVDKCMAALS